MIRRLFLVRHGPTHARGMVGWSDLPADLSDTAGIGRLAEWLPASATVVSSDLSRAVQTADAITGTRPRLPHDRRLREINFGAWELRSWKDISETDPDRIRAFYEKPGEIRAPGGDSWDSLRIRAGAAVDRHLAATDGDLIAVCHFGVVLSQVQRATGLPSYETFAQKIDNLSVSEILIEGGTWRPGVINHCP